MTYEQGWPGWYGPGPPRGLDGPVGVPVGPLANGQSTTAFSETGTGVVAPACPPTTGWQLAPFAPPGPPDARTPGVEAAISSTLPRTAAIVALPLRRIALRGTVARRRPGRLRPGLRAVSTGSDAAAVGRGRGRAGGELGRVDLGRPQRGRVPERRAVEVEEVGHRVRGGVPPGERGQAEPLLHEPQDRGVVEHVVRDEVRPGERRDHDRRHANAVA